MNNRNTYIIIPAFNEETVIATVVNELIGYGYSIVVVDDASTDNTSAVVRRLPVVCLRHKINMGQGAALQTGITYALKAGGEYFITFDADGQHSPSDIPLLLETLTSGTTDFVFGSRFLINTKSGAGLLRKCVLQIARYLNFFLTGILLSDAHNGLRAFNRKAASVIHIRENRMAHATELLLIVKKKKLRYIEIPVLIRYTPYSKSKGQKNFHSFKVLQDILLHKFFR